MKNGFVKLQNEILFKKHLKNNNEAQKMFSKELRLNFKKGKSIPEYGRIQLKR